MSPRLRRATRFALPNLLALLAAGFGYELLEAFVRGDVPDGMTAAGAVAANMPLWALFAFVGAAVTFLLKLSDIVPGVPGWGFAWLGAAWVALACVLAVHATESGRLGLAASVGIVAVVLWLAIHRLLPGWPGARPRPNTITQPSGAEGQAAGRDLP